MKSTKHYYPDNCGCITVCCGQQSTLKTKILGKWKISDMHIQYYERVKNKQAQIKMLQDK